MKDLERSRELLVEQIASTETKLAQLKAELERTDNHIAKQREENEQEKLRIKKECPRIRKNLFSQDEYRRYGRQMIVDQVGIKGQARLHDASVLIVGAGGLGCPAAVYLAGAGIGTIGIIDGDTVEESNLHRQILHRTRNVGKFKVDSAVEYLRELNPHPKYVVYRTHLTPQEAPDIFASYDVILDCTDNPATRYLISDTAVLQGKVLVSASALRTEGQLMILNYPPQAPGDSSGGPCYRCVFPKPPPAASVVSCADGGILGPVVGLMGVMQALEAIRVITNPLPPPPPSAETNSTPPQESPITPSLHLFSAYDTPPFRNIKLRRRRKDCAACSATPAVTLDSLRSGSTDYIQFCGSASPASLLQPDERVAAAEYNQHYYPALPSTTAATPQAGDGSCGNEAILIDVREKVQYDICALANSINIPMSKILSSTSSSTGTQPPPSLALSSSSSPTATTTTWLQSHLPSSLKPDTPIYVVCRLGNDSQVVVRRLKELGLDEGGKRVIADIRGGLRAWREEVDPDLPDY